MRAGVGRNSKTRPFPMRNVEMICNFLESFKISNMGYELERFVDKVPNVFVCIICHEVVKHAVECSLCESLYCSECS